MIGSDEVIQESRRGDMYKELYQGRVAKGLHDLQAFIRAN